MATERNVVDFKIHNLTEEKFQELKAQGKIDPNAVYCTPDDSLKTSQITNCITEIPQDIKLELADGAIILKAGSKVYVPNGSGNYTKITIEKDLSRTVTSGFEGILVYYPEEKRLSSININYCSSGTVLPSAPIGTNHWVHYKTDDNKIYYTEDAGETWSRTYSFPLCIFTSEETNIPEEATITKINQVFNGFGYIGSVLFALPGVKGLVPNGRNNNGTLNNRQTTLNEVSVYTKTGDYQDLPMYMTYKRLYNATSGLSYNEETNYFEDKSGTHFGVFLCGYISSVGSGISFRPRTTFHAVDYSDFETLSDTVETLSDTVETLSDTVETNNNNAVHKTDFENTVEELNGSISAVDSSVVHKTGDETIGGIKTFTAPSLRISNVAGTGGTGLNILDSNGKGQTYLHHFYVNGNYYSRLVNRNATAAKTAYVEVVSRDNGATEFTSYNVDNMRAPTPAASSNGTNIATTAFVKSVLSSSGNGLATFSKGASGYYKFNNGLIIQWGRVGGSANERAVNFPTSFSNTNYAIVANPTTSNTTESFYSIATDEAQKYTSSCVLRCNGHINTVPWLWIAIGY